MSVNWADLGMPAEPAGKRVRDIWKYNSHGGDLGVHTGGYTVVVPKHSAVLIRAAD
jgi:hypothetical protein